MRRLIFIVLITMSTEVFAQKNLIDGELSLSTGAIAVNYEGFIINHFSLGAKLGLATIGAKANYYFKTLSKDQWNGHVGLGYELTFAWPETAFIYGPTFIIGGEHISSRGFLIGLEGGVMSATYGDNATYGDHGKPIYPMINFKIGKLF